MQSQVTRPGLSLWVTSILCSIISGITVRKSVRHKTGITGTFYGHMRVGWALNPVAVGLVMTPSSNYAGEGGKDERES